MIAQPERASGSLVVNIECLFVFQFQMAIERIRERGSSFYRQVFVCGKLVGKIFLHRVIYVNFSACAAFAGEDFAALFRA